MPRRQSNRTVAGDEGVAKVAVEYLPPDARSGELASLNVTLSATPGTITSVTLPDYAAGVRLYPYTDAVRFAVDEDPQPVGASSLTTIPASAFAIGGVAQPDQWETRVLEEGTSRTLRLRSTDASVVVTIEAF